MKWTMTFPFEVADMGVTGSKIRKPSMERVIFLIEERGGKLHTSDIRDALGMSEGALYNAGVNAVAEGYLTKHLVKCTDGVGRKQVEYQRTNKPYAPPPVTEKTAQNRLRKERERERVEGSKTTPHRHLWDEWLFGAYPKPFEPHALPRRVYRQAMDVNDELEAAA
jgi:hypothetical protein